MIPAAARSRRRLAGAVMVVVIGALASVAAARASGSGGAGEGSERAGVTVEGVDHGLWRMPPEAVVADYANDGYRLTVREGWVEVEVHVQPLTSAAPFEPAVGSPDPGDELSRLARSLAVGAETRYGAVSRVLSWVARNIRYELDREASQDPEAVAQRRSAYCTGIARLSVALLDRVGIEAREVSGFVFSDDRVDSAGYHRWIEVFYPDRGWVFSDPLHSHHFVPANYVRLASETLELGRLGPTEEVLFRDRRLPARDSYPYGPASVMARPNQRRQIAAALRVELVPAHPARLTLSGMGISRSASSDGAPSTFVGLEPGQYRLEVESADGRVAVRRRVRLHDRVRTDLLLRLPSTLGDAAGAARP